MSAKKPWCPTTKCGQVPGTNNSKITITYNIHLHDKITIEQQKRPPIVLIQKGKDEKRSNTEKETHENERNNKKQKEPKNNDQ